MTGLAEVLRRLWPRRLAGQLIALLLLALVLAQVTSFLIFEDERWAALRTAERKHILSRTASIVRLIESTPPALHEQIVRTASSRQLRFWLSEQSAVAAGDADGRQLAAPAPRRPARGWPDPRGADRPARRRPAFLVARRARRRGEEHVRPPTAIGEGARAAGADGEARRERWHHRRLPPDLAISIRLADGRWLNTGLAVPDPSPRWALPSLIAMAVMAIALSLIVVVMVRRITRPLAELAVAAERLGRGEAVPPLAENGPLDIRQTTRAFNRMRGRLQRFVQDRTRMLAAISHDLRTPITTLRLRAEFLDDEENRAKILETLDEMQRMTEATLAFAREEAAAEDTRTVDLAALVDSVCADLADLGQDVTFRGPERAPYACRPVSLKRALRNLIENAVAYGARARVTLEQAEAALEVVIDDDGPGIPEAEFERVFAPFVRLEESRSPETGGIGLGMAIARSIVRGHGGEITLHNRPEGGLRVAVRLPLADAA